MKRSFVLIGCVLLGVSGAQAGGTGAPTGVSTPTADVKACVQADPNNTAVIQQSSQYNVAACVQAGENNAVGIIQQGGNNTASTTQIQSPLPPN